MKRYKYKNITKSPMWFPGIGKIEGEQEFSSSVIIENPNIELVELLDDGSAPVAEPVVATQAPQPNMVTDIKPATGVENNG